MSGKAKKRLPKVYYTAPNGIKIELKGFGPPSFYAQEQVRTEFAKAFQVPKDMLFPDKKAGRHNSARTAHKCCSDRRA